MYTINDDTPPKPKSIFNNKPVVSTNSASKKSNYQMSLSNFFEKSNEPKSSAIKHQPQASNIIQQQKINVNQSNNNDNDDEDNDFLDFITNKSSNIVSNEKKPIAAVKPQLYVFLLNKNISFLIDFLLFTHLIFISNQQVQSVNKNLKQNIEIDIEKSKDEIVNEKKKLSYGIYI